MTYWHYTYIKPGPGKGFTVGYGTYCTLSVLDSFNFAAFYRQNPDCYILNLNRIDRTQYEALNVLIEEEKTKGGGMTDDKFDFRQCWTCTYCIYDLSKRLHKCSKTGAWLRRNVHLPTDCKDWRNTGKEFLKREEE